MTTDGHISNFLRDAQYRIAKISIEMNEIEDKGSYQYDALNHSRAELSVFMSILYEGKYLIDGGYNHLQIGTGKTWTDRELISEIEYLRYYHKMNEVPYITFTQHYPKIIAALSGGGSGSSGSLPSGNLGQLMGFDANGTPTPIDYDVWGGHRDGESINSYFSGRV